MASSVNVLRRLLRWAKVSRNWGDDTNWPIQQFTYLGKTGDAVDWFPYGYHANVPAGHLSLLACLQGKAEARVAFPGSPLERPRVASNELVIYHPRTKTLYAGDAINERAGPVTMFGDVRDWRKWVAGLEKLQKLEIERIVPGHGDVCGPEIIDQHIEALEKKIAEAV